MELVSGWHFLFFLFLLLLLLPSACCCVVVPCFFTRSCGLLFGSPDRRNQSQGSGIVEVDCLSVMRGDRWGLEWNWIQVPFVHTNAEGNNKSFEMTKENGGGIYFALYRLGSGARACFVCRKIVIKIFCMRTTLISRRLRKGGFSRKRITHAGPPPYRYLRDLRTAKIRKGAMVENTLLRGEFPSDFGCPILLSCRTSSSRSP